MSNGGGSGWEGAGLRSGDLWGGQLIFERMTFIFLETQNTPMKTNLAVATWIPLHAHTDLKCAALECVFMWDSGRVCAHTVHTD